MRIITMIVINSKEDAKDFMIMIENHKIMVEVKWRQGPLFMIADKSYFEHNMHIGRIRSFKADIHERIAFIENLD